MFNGSSPRGFRGDPRGHFGVVQSTLVKIFEDFQNYL